MDIKRSRILMVEDNEADARLVREAVAETAAAMFEIIGVERLSEALTLLELEKEGFDAVLLDLSLPDAQGLGTLMRITEAAPSVPIIVMTGSDDEELAMKAVHHGAQEYLVKGEANLKSLTRTVRYAIERQKIDEELKKTRKAAEEAMKIKDKFLSLIAHDLLTPLTSTAALLKVAAMDTNPPLHPTHAKTIAQALGTVDGMAVMIEELLNMSRLQTGMIVPQKRFIDASFVAMSVIDRMAHAALQKGVKLVNNVPHGTRIYADLGLISEVFFNLISNGIKFTPPGGGVTVFVPENDRWVIAVGDTGVGIAKENLDKLFQHEVKFTTPGTAGEKGTGLGLPLSRDIMKAHDGDIRVDSQPGRGSIFSIVLPPVKPVVLIVDDDKLMRLMFRDAVSELNAEIIEAEHGQQAVDIIETVPPHLILLDIMMPVMDGYEMLEYLRKNPKTKLLPVIIITSATDMATREKCFRLGADDLVTKPFVIEELIPRIRRYII